MSPTKSVGGIRGFWMCKRYVTNVDEDAHVQNASHIFRGAKCNLQLFDNKR